MRPALPAGRIIVAVYPARRVRVGDVVVLQYGQDELIKRIDRVRPGYVYVRGDDATASTDSRSFGWLAQSAICGKVIWPRTRPPAAA